MLHKETTIDATREKIFEVLTADEPYRDWCSGFMPGSRYEGDWSEGSEMRFIGPSENGKEGGMISLVTENEAGRVIEMRAVGEIRDGVDDRSQTEWSGMVERYEIIGEARPYTLKITQDVPESFQEYFDGAWDKCLARIKALAEG